MSVRLMRYFRIVVAAAAAAAAAASFAFTVLACCTGMYGLSYGLFVRYHAIVPSVVAFCLNENE